MAGQKIDIRKGASDGSVCLLNTAVFYFIPSLFLQHPAGPAFQKLDTGKPPLQYKQL